MYLALMVVSLWAAFRPQPGLARMAGLAWLIFSIPHLIYHASHLDMYDAFDKIANMVSLGGTVILAALLLRPERATATTRNLTGDSSRPIS